MDNTYPKSNSPQRPGVPGRADTYDPEEMVPSAYPEDRDDIQVDDTAIQALKAQYPMAHTPYNVTQTTDEPATQTVAEVIHNVKGGTAEIAHGDYHDAKEAAKTYVSASVGTYSIPPEESSTIPHKRQTTHKLKDALHQVQGDVATDSQAPSTLAKVSPDVPLPESLGSMKISGEPTTLPSAVQHEYYRSAMARDVDDDPSDLGETVYEDEVPFVDDSRMILPGRRAENRAFEAGDRARDREMGGYVHEDVPEPVDRGYEKGGVAVGHGGVTYNCFGQGGVLPGYPTPEGMGKLIFDRMRDDQLRLAGSDNLASVSVPTAITRSTNSSRDYPPIACSLPSQSTRSHHDTQGSGSGSGEERTVPCLDFRIIEERRESPVFEDGSSSNPGEFEATYKPDISRNSREGQNLILPALPTTIQRSIDKSSDASPIIARSLPADFTRDNLAMRGGDSGLGFLQEERSVHSFDNRAAKERRETTVFENDGQTAFQHVSSSADLDNRESIHDGHKPGSSDSAMGLSSSVETGTTGGLQPEYLGKLISTS